MAAKGQAEKEFITSKILETFEGSFAIDKEIRIPFLSNGEEIQIKCVLTAAAKNVANPAGSGVLTEAGTAENVGTTAAAEPRIAEPSPEEKERVSNYLKMLGITQ